MQTIAAVFFLIVLLLFSVLYLRGKKTYAAYIDALDQKDYNLKSLMPVGFQLMEWSRHRYNSNFDRSLRRDLAELHDKEYVEFYLRVTWALAATGIVLGLLLGGLFFLAMADVMYLGIGVLLAGGIAFAAFQDSKKKVEERHRQIAISLPDLTNQIIILTGAGLTLRGALLKIAKEMPGDTPLYEMLGKAAEQMEHGATDDEALNYLTVKCNMPQMRRFVSILLQNMHRGGGDVRNALQEIGSELWSERKAAAQRIAEETGMKLLFPMMFMLIAVIILVAAPAVMGMGI